MGLVVLAASGLLHVLDGAPKLSGPVDALRDAGGYLGAIVGAPLTAGLGRVGASVILGGLLLFGALLAPGTSIRHVLGLIARGITAARQLVVDALDLRDGGDDEGIEDQTDRRPLPSRRATVEAIELELPDDEIDVVEEREPIDDAPIAAEVVEIEDEVDDPDDAFIDEPTEIAVREADRGQMAIDLTAYGHGDWTLPPRDLLKRSTAKAMDERVVEQGGEVLEATLKDFGVDARLIGMTVGPTVTRYELELAPGVKVNRVTGLSHDIAVRDGVARRAHPRAHPRSQRDRRRGAEQAAPARDARRRARVARGRRRRPTRSRSGSAATSRASR